MRVKIKELKEGCILSQDVFSRTNRPIIPKKTVITDDLIEILYAFLIPEVSVERTLVNGSAFLPKEIIDEEDNQSNKQEFRKIEESFTELFLSACNNYKKEFLSWLSGMPLDVTKVRSIIVPLLEQSLLYPSELFNIHHFSTRDEYHFHHSVAVGLISGFIGGKLNLNKGDIVQLTIAGCLADCGMAKVPPAILNKKSSLTYSEFEEIKKHPLYSFTMVQNSTLLREGTKIAILQHHERLDGSGYPRGEKEKIHSFAKIIAVADTFHALTSERQYRTKQSPFKVLEMMIQDNFGKFDIAALRALQKGVMNFSIGTKVKLSDGQIGEIVFIDEQSPTRPLVKLEGSGVIIHLEKNRQLFIEEVYK